MKFRLLVFFTMIAVLPSVAKAQGFSPKSLELTLSEGVSLVSSKKFQIGPPQSSTPLDFKMKFDLNNIHELRLNFLTTNRFGAEGFYSYEATPVVFERTTEPTQSLKIPLQLHHFGANVLYYVTGGEESKWRPFVAVGGGALLFRPTGSGQEIATDPLRGNLSTFIESSRAAVNIGAGLKRSFGYTFGLRFDVNDIISSAPTFGLPKTSDLSNDSVLPASGLTNNVRASVGIILYLGK